MVTKDMMIMGVLMRMLTSLLLCPVILAQEVMSGRSQTVLVLMVVTTTSPTSPGSPPAKLNARQKRPMPKPRTRSLNTDDGTPDVSIAKTSNHDPYPTEVCTGYII